MSTSYLLFVKQNYYLSLLSIVLLVITVVNIFMYFNKINQWIAFFLLGIENEDTSLKAPSKTGNKAIDDIYTGITRLNELFKQTKIEISTQEQYFRSIINQSATGLFSINESGRIININPTAIKLTGLQDYHHVNVLSAIDAALPSFMIHPIKKYKINNLQYLKINTGKNYYSNCLKSKIKKRKSGLLQLVISPKNSTMEKLMHG